MEACIGVRTIENILLFIVVISMGLSALWLAISGRARFKERARNATTKAKARKKNAKIEHRVRTDAAYKRRVRNKFK